MVLLHLFIFFAFALTSSYFSISPSSFHSNLTLFSMVRVPLLLLLLFAFHCRQPSSRPLTPSFISDFVVPFIFL